MSESCYRLPGSPFNAIIPQQLILKLVQQGLNTSLCNWEDRVGNNNSSPPTTQDPPQGCVLSSLLFTLLTYDYIPTPTSMPHDYNILLIVVFLFFKYTFIKAGCCVLDGICFAAQILSHEYLCIRSLASWGGRRLTSQAFWVIYCVTSGFLLCLIRSPLWCLLPWFTLLSPLPQFQPPSLPLLYFSVFISFSSRNIHVSSVPCCSVSVSPSSLPLCVSLQVSCPWCCVDFSGGPSVCCQHLSRMLQLPCYIPVAA